MFFSVRSWVCVLQCALTICSVLAIGSDAAATDQGPQNLASKAVGGQIKSWEPGVPKVPGYEPEKANDGSFRSFWTVPAHGLPADLGVEWAEPREVSSIIVRFATGQTLPELNSARTQQFARLEYWKDGKWRPLDAQVSRGGTTVLRCEFPAITTQRIRVLFPELPHFLDRIAPDQSGIDVSEFEVYRTPPYQRISAAKGLAEEQGGDSLVIEPLATRVFNDTLRPTLIVAESRWADAPCSAKSSAQGAVTIENGFLALALSTKDGLKETRLTNRVTDESIATDDSQAFVIRTSGGEITPDRFKIDRVEIVAAGPEMAEVCVALTSPELDVSVHYQLLQQDHFFHKWLTLQPKGTVDLQVLDVTVSALALPRPTDLVTGPVDQDLSYPISRLERGGFFSCLEAVHWDHAGDALTYYPGETLKLGDTFTSEKAVVGVFRNRGVEWLGLDEGVREWVVEYHAHISPTSEQWPYVYCEGWSAGLRLLDSTAESLERRMACAERMGIRHMDGFEPMNEAMAAPDELVKQWVEIADRHRINTGWWIDWGSKRAWGGSGKPIMYIPCKLSPDTEAYLQDILAFVKKHHLRSFHWGDFLRLWPCDNPNHGHLPGKYSLYAQGKRIIRFGQELREASPGVALNADRGWTNPQYTRYLDHGDHIDAYDHRPAAAPDIHLDRLYASMNRRYQLSHYGNYTHPWYRTLNCANHYGMESHRHDRAGFRFGLLSALAISASVTFNDFSEEMPESEAEFTRHWLEWARTNKDYLKQGDILFDRTFGWTADVQQGNPETLCGMAHVRKDRGFVFLMNYSPVEQIADFDLALDAPADARFAVEEIYPGGMVLAGPDAGLYRQGGRLRVTVPGYQVRILWLAPATAAPSTRNREDARAEKFRRFLADWSIASQSGNLAVLKSHFEFPAAGSDCLSQTVPEAEWQKEPWAFNKAYLVLQLKDEGRDLNDHWLSDGLYATKTQAGEAGVRINGVVKPVHTFLTRRNQARGMTRCYFVELAGEIKAGAVNEIEVAVPISAGLNFGGAYLDLPDQMPAGDQAQ